MQDHSPLSPEERRKQLASLSAAYGPEAAAQVRPRIVPLEVVKRIAVGVYNDGFIHAGNLAYLSLLALFPFFILAAAIAKSAHRNGTTLRDEALASGAIDALEFDRLMDPVLMIRPRSD